MPIGDRWCCLRASASVQGRPGTQKELSPDALPCEGAYGLDERGYSPNVTAQEAMHQGRTASPNRTKVSEGRLSHHWRSA